MLQRTAFVAPDDAVDVWTLALASCPAPCRDDARALLSPDERARADRFHFARDRDRFVAARAGLRRVLAGYAGCAPGHLAFGYTSHGKPFLVGAGADLAFNLSHAHELALVAVTRGRDVGVDVERVRADVELESLARTSFSRAEQQALLALPPAERVDGFFRGWTRKESYIKARGEGLSLPLDRFSVSLGPGDEVAFEPDDPAERARWTIRALAVPPGYAAALTVSGACPPVRRLAP